MVVKARHQGNSLVLTIPNSINAQADTEYEVFQDANGNIVYKPIKKEIKYDIWSDSSYDNLDYDQLIAEEYHDLGYNPRELKPVGRELPKDD